MGTWGSRDPITYQWSLAIGSKKIPECNFLRQMSQDFWSGSCDEKNLFWHNPGGGNLCAVKTVSIKSRHVVKQQVVCYGIFLWEFCVYGKVESHDCLEFHIGFIHDVLLFFYLFVSWSFGSEFWDNFIIHGKPPFWFCQYTQQYLTYQPVTWKRCI